MQNTAPGLPNDDRLALIVRAVAQSLGLLALLVFWFIVISVLEGKANRNKDISCLLGNTHAGPKWIALKRQMLHELTVEEVVQANPNRNIFDVCTDRVIGNSVPIVTDLTWPL